MTKTTLLLLAFAWCAPAALAAPPDDVLLDDFGQPITSENDAILPPAPVKPQAKKTVVKAKPKTAPAKVVAAKKPDCSAEKKKLGACADDYLKKSGATKAADKLALQRLIVGKACPTAAANFLGCAGFEKAGSDEVTATVQASIAQFQKSWRPAPKEKTEPKAEVAKKTAPKPAPKAVAVPKTEERPPAVAAGPKVVPPPKSMQQKFPQTIWVFSGPDEEQARLAKKAARPTILPPVIEKTPDGSQPERKVELPPAPSVKAEAAPVEKPAAKPEVAKVIVPPKPEPAPALRPKDESRVPLTTPEKMVKAEDKDGRGELPPLIVPPAPDTAGDPEENEAQVPETGDEPGDKKDTVRVVRIPPPPAAPAETRPAESAVPAAAETTPEDSAPVTETAPGDFNAFVNGTRIPNFIRINVQGYNVRKTPEFEPGRKDNIDFQTVAGSLFAVTRVVPTEEGVATGIYVDGDERWIFMPWSRRGDYQFCESEACFADVAMGLDAIASAGRIDPNDLLACGVLEPVKPDAPIEVHPLPKRPSEAAFTPSPRTKAELSALDSRVNHAPSVKVQYSAKGCVVDTRDRPKPNFRAFRSTAQMRRAFIDYMTPFALEVQEATGLPAAVVIGQAALESGWGTSGLFLNTKNIFGHSCWRRGSRRTLSLDINGQNKHVTGVCDTPRPSYAGGYYMTFRDSQDSVYAYAANLLSHQHNYYPQVRAAVRRAQPRPANWREVVDGLRNYDGPNPAYRSLVRDIIVRNGLDRLETKKLCR